MPSRRQCARVELVETRVVKYMGSKHFLLANGLGQLIVEESRQAERIVDLFCGGSSVAWFAAENTGLPVLAIDLQHYAVTLAGAVVRRTRVMDPGEIATQWLGKTIEVRRSSNTWAAAQELGTSYDNIEQFVETSRKLCSSIADGGPVWSAYGGHYFSPFQAATVDAMLESLPEEEPIRTVCLAAVIASGSHCAAAPGHTAQPFQPTSRAAPFLAEAWARNPLDVAKRVLGQVCLRRAQVEGDSVAGEAVAMASTLSSSDLVIVDPPYSGVQYSRFYHVLETIATGLGHTVKGKGRYPPLSARPQSSFSRTGESRNALVSLLENLARVRATVLFTFPTGKCSNGLSGDLVIDASKQLFQVEERRITGRFSTLGGNNTNRAARSTAEELILVMRSDG